MVTLVLSPTSNPSVLAPREPASPAESSMVIPVRVRPFAPSTEKAWTGVFNTLRFWIVEDVRSCAAKNLGLVLPPLLPSPSHHAAPLPSMTEPAAPVTVMSVPETEMSGPSHSEKPKVVVPSNMTLAQWKISGCGSTEGRVVTGSMDGMKLTSVPVVRSVMSRVVPEGTAMLLSTIVAHDFLLADAEAAFVNVHEVALSWSFAAAEGAGAGAGAAATRARPVKVSSTLRLGMLNIVGSWLLKRNKRREYNKDEGKCLNGSARERENNIVESE